MSSGQKLKQTFGILESSGTFDPCELKKGDIFYLLVNAMYGISKSTYIEKRKVLDIHCWTEHVIAPDYLGGDYDEPVCSLTYCLLDDPEDIRKVPKVPSTWKIFRTEAEAMQYVVNQLKDQQEKLTLQIKELDRLRKEFEVSL